MTEEVAAPPTKRLSSNSATISAALRQNAALDSSSSSFSENRAVVDPSSSSPTTSSGGGGGGGGDEQESQLEKDLALFLANPSLRAALADGSLDLSSYSNTLATELSELEDKCIAAYRSKATEIHCLKDDIHQCSTVLAALHEMLLGFQADLGGLSGDIRNLQDKSRLLDVQVRNRRAAERYLRHFLEHLVVAPSTANAITEGPVNSTFLAAVQEIQRLYKDCISTQSQDWALNQIPSETVSGKECREQLEVLRLTAAKRSREYLLNQMALLRRPQTNVRIIQVHGLLKYSALYDFLQDVTPDIATEIFNVYCESMSHTFQQLFRTYSQQLATLEAAKCTRTDYVICLEDATILRGSSSSSSSTPGRTRQLRTDSCSLGPRATDCMEQQAAILAHVALQQKKEYPYELLFRSLLGHLVDAVTNEHVVTRQFFKRDAFPQLFNSTLSLLTEQLENYLFACYDALCILLMIKVTHSYRRLAKSRKIHSLDAFLDDITHLLWPRLKTVMDGHLRSIQQAVPEKLGTIDLHAHYTSRRFGEFCCSILLILHNNSSKSHQQPSYHRQRKSEIIGAPSASKYTGSVAGQKKKAEEQPQSAGDKLLQDLSEMMDAFVVLLERLSEVHNTQKKRTVFLINNLDHIVCIFQERRVTGKECSKFSELLLRQRELFVEEELLTGFSKMIAFVQQTEAHLASSKNSGGDANVNAEVVESLVLDFASNWRSNIEQINRNVLSYFSNFRNGMEILKHCLTQLLLYYTRFQDIIRKVWKGKPPAFCKDLVSTTVILAEIKKYALAI